MRRKATLPEPKPSMTTATAMLERRRYVLRLMHSGLTFAQIAENAVGLKPGWDEGAIRRAYDGIRAEQRKGFEAEQKDVRIQAIARLSRDLADLRNPGQLRNKNGYPVFENVLDTSGKPVRVKGRNLKRPVMAAIDYARVKEHEALRAKIEGTLQPIELKVDADVTIRQSLLAVVANLTPERLDELANEEDEPLSKLPR